MRIITKISTLRQVIKELKLSSKKIGFVPTMGALHQGHGSLLQKSRREKNITVLSIFVNPKQFGPHEDYLKYPREEKKDEILAKKENVDIIFYPSVEEMYPKGYLTYVKVKHLSDSLCGKSRPGHFKGVGTIVLKLLNIVTPDILYLGQKDAQQAILLNKMIADLNLPIQVKICPTIREKDGLAMSSRNVYLTKQQRKEAAILFESLSQAKKNFLEGELNAHKIIQRIKNNITKNTSAMIDYIQCVDIKTLQPSKKITQDALIALAVKFGNTRLIDNILLKVS